MRFRSTGKSGDVVAVCGTNTVSFGMLPTDEVKDGLIGFAVERVDPDADERYYLPGFKVFRSVFPNPVTGLYVSTFEQPVQSFVWDDFTAKADHAYTYRFHPLKGRAKHLNRSTAALSIDVRTEPLVRSGHDVFFNRGVASSQAYEREFGTTPIDQLDPRAATAHWPGSPATWVQPCCGSSTTSRPASNCSAASTSSTTRLRWTGSRPRSTAASTSASSSMRRTTGTRTRTGRCTRPSRGW
jgi:hypothetical protein